MPSVMLALKVRLCLFLDSWPVSCSQIYIKACIYLFIYYLYLLESHFGSFYLEIYVLTLKMTWNHEIILEMDFENHIFAYLILTITL